MATATATRSTRPRPRTRRSRPRSASVVTRDETDIVTKPSPRSVVETVSRLTELLDTRGIKLFAVIDQSAAARDAGLQLRETVLVIFGNPALGTQVMAASPFAALDLPLKVLIWADDGVTRVSYTAA